MHIHRYLKQSKIKLYTKTIQYYIGRDERNYVKIGRNIQSI